MWKVSGRDNTIAELGKIKHGCEPRDIGDGGPVTQAKFDYPVGVATDKNGNVYITDYHHHVVRKVSSSDNTITTIAGTGGSEGYSGDERPATQAQLSFPAGVTVDGHGNVYIADYHNHRIRKVSAVNNTITTIAGTGHAGYNSGRNTRRPSAIVVSF